VKTPPGHVFFVASLLVLLGCSPKQPREYAQAGRVNDFAGILSENATSSLSSRLEAYERETCHQLVVLVVPSLKGEPIQELSSRTFLSWKIGHPALNNGILLTIAIDEGKARIEAGPSLESIVEGGAAENILRQEMFPLFQAGDIEKGIAVGVESIMRAAGRLEIPADLRPDICR